MKRLLILALLSLGTLKGFAAGAGSHGGDVVMCFKGPQRLQLSDEVRSLLKRKINPFDAKTLSQIDSVRLLDYWEYGVEKRDYRNLEEAISDTLLSIQNAFPYYNKVRKTLKKLDFNNYASLPILSDEGIVPNVPKGCLIVQIAIQRDNGVVLVDQELFKLLSVHDQAGLYLHEAIYNMGIEKKHKDSSFVRVINSFVAEEKVHEEDEVYFQFSRNYLDFFKQEDDVIVNGKKLRTFSIVSELSYWIYSSDEISLGDFTLPKGTGLQAKTEGLGTSRSFQLNETTEVNLSGYNYKLNNNDQITWSETDSKVKRIRFDKLKNISGFNTYAINEFYSTGEPKVLFISEYIKQNFKIGGGSNIKVSTQGKLLEIVDKYPVGGIPYTSSVMLLFNDHEYLCNSSKIKIENGELTSCETIPVWSRSLNKIKGKENSLVAYSMPIYSKTSGYSRRSYDDLAQKAEFHFSDGKIKNITFDKNKGLLIQPKGKKYYSKREIREDVCKTGKIIIEEKKFACK